MVLPRKLGGSTTPTAERKPFSARVLMRTPLENSIARYGTIGVPDHCDILEVLLLDDTQVCSFSVYVGIYAMPGVCNHDPVRVSLLCCYGGYNCGRHVVELLHAALHREEVVLSLNKGELSLPIEGVFESVESDQVRITEYPG